MSFSQKEPIAINMSELGMVNVNREENNTTDFRFDPSPPIPDRSSEPKSNSPMFKNYSFNRVGNSPPVNPATPIKSISKSAKDVFHSE